MTTDTFNVDNPNKPTILKDPDAVLDYLWDWTEWLAGVVDIQNSPELVPDVITSYEVFAYGSPVDITVGVLAQLGGRIVAYLSGGTLGHTHPVTCRIHTAGGRTEDRTIYLKIRAR
jgi:hypothetical protein